MAANSITTIDFHGAALLALDRPEGIFVPLSPICEAIGIDAQKQRERARRDPVLSEGLVSMTVPTVGGPQDMLCLRLDLLNGWLFGIEHERVRPEARDAVLTYKRECYRILCEHFQGSPRRSSDNALAVEAAKLRQVAMAQRIFGKEAAAQVWKELGLVHVQAMEGLQGSLFPKSQTS